MTDLVTYATTETRWARGMRRVLMLVEPTPIYDQLTAETAEPPDIRAAR